MNCIHKTAKIEKNVTLGNNITIYEKVVVKSGATIFDGAVIGRPPKSAGNTTRKINTKLPPLVIGNGSIIGANSVLYAGIKIGNNVLIGDLASIREGCIISDGAVVGRGTMVMYDTKIGKRTRIIDGAIITGNSTIESDVFIGPGVNSINDNYPYLSRFKLGQLIIKGPTIKRYALIGAGANLNAEITIGIGAIVAPNSMVTHDVKPWTVVMGTPAKATRIIGKKEKMLILNYFKRN